MKEFLIENLEWIFLGFWFAEKIVKMTPKKMKIFGFQIGKYDDIVVDGLKTLLLKLMGIYNIRREKKK